MKRLPLIHRPMFWENLLWVLLTSSLALCILFWMLQWWISTALVACIFLVMVYGSFLEPQRIILNKKSIHIKDAPHLRVAIASDFHTGAYKDARFVRRVVDRINALQPDLILLPGDFLDDADSPLENLEPLKNLKAPHGVFAVIGNHDAGTYRRWGKGDIFTTTDRSREVQDTLQGMGIIVLRNAHRILIIDGKTLAIAGTDDAWMESCDLQGAFAGIPGNTPIILLTHSPDAILNEKSLRADLIISGHTHGGQIRLPFIGAIGPIPDHLGRKYDHGLFGLENDCQLYITHGVGETGVRARLCCPPEIVVLSIRPR